MCNSEYTRFVSVMTSPNGVIVQDLAPPGMIFIRLSKGMTTSVSNMIADKMCIRATGEGRRGEDLVRTCDAGLAVSVFHDTRFINLPFTFFDVGTFIVLFLTFRDADFHFAPGIFPVQRERHYGIAFTIDATI